MYVYIYTCIYQGLLIIYEYIDSTQWIVTHVYMYLDMDVYIYTCIYVFTYYEQSLTIHCVLSAWSFCVYVYIHIWHIYPLVIHVC